MKIAPANCQTLRTSPLWTEEDGQAVDSLWFHAAISDRSSVLTVVFVLSVFDPQMFPTLRQIWRYWRSAARGMSSWFGCRGVITTAQWQVNKCCRRIGTFADGVLNTGLPHDRRYTCGRHLRPTATRPFRERYQNIISPGSSCCAEENDLLLSRGQTGRRPTERQQ